MIELRSVYESDQMLALSVKALWKLLQEREPHESISHVRMPSLAEHVAFVKSRPYKEWMVIAVDHSVVGAIYLSKADEIGVSILRRHRQRGYASEAIRTMVRRHSGVRLFANIHSANMKSRHLFTRCGFLPLAVTFVLEPKQS